MRGPTDRSAGVVVGGSDGRSRKEEEGRGTGGVGVPAGAGRPPESRLLHSSPPPQSGRGLTHNCPIATEPRGRGREESDRRVRTLRGGWSGV